MNEKIVKKFDRLVNASNKHLVIAAAAGIISLIFANKAYKDRQNEISLFKEVINKGE